MQKQRLQPQTRNYNDECSKMDKGMNFQWYSTYVNNLLQVHVHEMKNEEMNEYMYLCVAFCLRVY